MSTLNCTVEQNGKRYSVEASTGMRLLDVLNMIEEIHIDAPCGGNGTCGKCKVRALQEQMDTGLDSLHSTEQDFLSPSEIDMGIRLCCQAVVQGNCHILLLNEDQYAAILSDTSHFQGKLDPPIKKTCINLPKPTIEDQRPDDMRVLEQLRSEGLYTQLSYRLRKRLPEILRKSDYQITVTHNSERIFTIESGNTTARHCGIAVDVGTTTVVAYLVSLQNGDVVDTISGLNRQKAYGGDVISRIEYVIREADGIDTLQSKIRNQIEEMMDSLVEKRRLVREDISMISIAGNTIMMHLFSGMNPEAIAAAPFIPVSLQSDYIPADELGFRHYRCPVLLLPSLSGYVGADISAGIVASGLANHENMNLLIDFGTNGEIVLGNRNRLFTCSTAAGPAFEGAQISHGMGGVSGAINSVFLEEERLFYSTIGGKRPRGICGSGIFNIAALLVRCGAADYTGRMLRPEEAPSQKARQLLSHYVEENGEPAIRIASVEESESGEAILFTQKDLREVQLAKAAVAAGIESLLHEAGKCYAEVERIYIAGGFGNFIDKLSTVEIGLFPADMLHSIESIGNSAGKGAVLSMLSKEILRELSRIAETGEYIELSSSAFFQNAYYEHMYFPILE